jgi:succinoglycan biosynthesis transport protein ExoP
VPVTLLTNEHDPSMESTPITGQLDLRGYLRIISRRRAVILVATLVVLGLTLGYSLSKKPIYSASAQVLIPQQTVSSTLNPTVNQVPVAASAQRVLADDLDFANGDAVRKAAYQALGYEAGVSNSASATSDKLSFTAHSGDRAKAVQIANAWANGFITASQNEQISDYASKVDALGTTISALQSKAAGLPAGNTQIPAIQASILSLTQTVQQLQAESGLVNQTGPTVVNRATLPVNAISPRPVRTGIEGLLVGLVIGLGLAFGADRLDDSIRSREDLDLSSGYLSLVGLVPAVETWRKQSETHVVMLEDASSQAAEAYRSMRTAVQFLGIDKPLKVVGVTSPSAGDGKTTTVANLAVTFARSGRRVIVVSGDMRRPRIHQFFGVSNDFGLTSVLLGESSAGDGLQPVPGEPLMRLLASGPIPPNPAEVLSLDRVRTLIESIARSADLVIIDCPPTLPVTDALLLSRLVDGMIIVASAGITKCRDLQRTCELLRQVGAPLLGTVLNRVPTGGGYGYDYDYGYYYDDYSSSSHQKTNGPVPIPPPMAARATSNGTSNGHTNAAR